MKKFFSQFTAILAVFAMTFNVALATVDQDGGNNQVCNSELNLLTNGGFESPVVALGQGWDVYPNGTAGLGWSVSWNGAFAGAPVNANLELHRGVNGWLHDEGAQHAELDTDWAPGGSEQASVVISQDIPTIPGATYEISYAFSPRPGTGASENVLEVLVDGLVVATHGPVAGGGNTSWTTYTYEFEASDGMVTIAFRDAGTPNTLGTFIDNVSVRCIEEPEVCEPLYARIRTAERGWWMNWGTGNLDDWDAKGTENPPIYVGGDNLLHNSLGGNGYNSQEWFPLVDEETCEPIVDEAFDFDVPGVAVQRLDGSLRVVLFGSHEIGGNPAHLINREFAKGNIELSHDKINKLTGAWEKANGWFDPVDSWTRIHDVSVNDAENPMDARGSFNGNIHIHHPSYDTVRIANDLFMFHLVVTTGNDGFYANYNN